MIKDPLALDLLSKMLCLCPYKRITAREALKHDFFKLREVRTSQKVDH
jgi:serine/threonine protein kinase